MIEKMHKQHKIDTKKTYLWLLMDGYTGNDFA